VEPGDLAEWSQETMEKSPDAFRTISEVADELELPQHVLRFWETRFPQIKPLKRGGGRRYYRPDDVELLKGIRHLLYDHGYTIKGVQKLLKNNGNKFVAAAASGDLATMEALAAQSEAEDREEIAAPPQPNKAPPAFEDDQIVGMAKPPTHRRFFGLIGSGDENEFSATGPQIGKEDRALLQEALFDLLECKRLLDQVR
jgi:DNA-binding transcriptional MerR regulator